MSGFSFTENLLYTESAGAAQAAMADITTQAAEAKHFMSVPLAGEADQAVH